MEFIPFSTTQLEYLAKDDPILKPIFKGVFASDQLPQKPEFIKPCAYIVNTDPITEVGSHWFGIYTEQGKCEVMDSYGVPLNWYSRSLVVPWVMDNWESISSNAKSLQELNSNSCGQYALMYLKYRCRDKSMEDFTGLFSNDYVANDHKVGNMIKKEIKQSLKDVAYLPCQQYNFTCCYIDI